MVCNSVCVCVCVCVCLATRQFLRQACLPQVLKNIVLYGNYVNIAKQSYLTDESAIVDCKIYHYEEHHIEREIKNNVKTPQNSTLYLLPISE